MRHVKWTHRVKMALYRGKEALNLNKETLVHIGMAVVIAVCISAIILVTQAPSKGQHTADMARLEDGIVAMGAHVADTDDDVADLATDLATEVGTLEEQDEITQSQLDGVANIVAIHNGSINSLGTRIANAEADIALFGSPPEGYLTGTVGNYTLHAKSSVAGTFTANLHLVYSPPIGAGNATTYDEAVQAFYGGVNWAAANTTSYIPTVSYDGTDWGISQVWFNIGTFALEENDEVAIDIASAGLNSAYEPDFAYVEIYPALWDE